MTAPVYWTGFWPIVTGRICELPVWAAAVMPLIYQRQNPLPGLFSGEWAMALRFARQREKPRHSQWVREVTAPQAVRRGSLTTALNLAETKPEV